MFIDDVLYIDLTPGRCSCNCGQPCNPKRQFLQGHDARLKGELITAGRNGNEVQALDNTDGTIRHFHTATEAVEELFQTMADRVIAGINKPVRVPKGERKLPAGGKLEPKADRAFPVVVRAKVGRWPYVGTVEGDEFVYTDGRNEQQRTTKFTVLGEVS